MKKSVSIVSVAWLVYALAYLVLHDLLAPHAGVTAFVPVVITAWVGGAAAGLVAGLAAVPVTTLVAVIAGLPGTQLSLSVVIGATAMMLVGFVVGYTRDLDLRLVQRTTSHQRDERALRESEARFRTLLEHDLDGVTVVADGKIVYANLTAGKMFGCDEAEMVGAEPSSFVVSSDKERARDRVRGLSTGEIEPSATEFEGLRKDGTSFPVEILSRPIDFDGRPALLAQLRDLTHRRSQEAALREAEEKYRTLVEHSLAGVAIVQHRRFRYANPKFAEILGCTQDEVLALQSFLDPVHEDDRAIVQEKHRQRVEDKLQPAPYTARVRRKDGRIVEVETNGMLTSYQGEPATISTILDVTERRRAYQQISESEKLFRTLFEESPIGIVLASPEGIMRRVNTTFCEMLEYAEEELIGRSIVEISHPDDAAGTPDSAAKVLKDAEFVVRLNKRYRRKGGAIVQAETTVSIVKDGDGKALYAVAMVEDVTEKRRLEEQLQGILRLESVGQLAGGVAHNFNNALAAISGYSELLARRFDAKDPALLDLEQIQRVTEQSAQLTQQLLAFSRAEHLRPSVFCLNDPIESTRDLLSPLLGDELRIHLRLDRNLPNISSDRSQIEQVITNLVLSARDAMPDGGVLTIETKTVELDQGAADTNPEAKPGRYARLTVADTGVGMDRDTAARVFEPFFTTKEPGRGVGLGLAMVHGVVKQSGGFIRVDSEPMTGSTFSVHLPEAALTPQPHEKTDVVH